jgi:hypothetical protein
MRLCCPPKLIELYVVMRSCGRAVVQVEDPLNGGDEIPRA